MNILLVADLHYALRQLDWLLEVAPDFDAVFIAGDLIDSHGTVPREVQVVVLIDYLRQLAKRTRVLVCSGNHDLIERNGYGEREARWLADTRGLGIATDGDTAELATGVLVSVLPWWDGPAAREDIERQLKSDAGRRQDRWFWLYHAPPADTAVAWAGKRTYGDGYLADWIETHRPDIVVCGHVHQAPFVPAGSWVDRIEDTWVFNMGQQPGASPCHIVLNLDAEEAAWFSFEGREHLHFGGDATVPTPLDGLPGWLTNAGRSRP
ncbi:MAG: metallophosphoesterase [Pseudomonadota bacterium]